MPSRSRMETAVEYAQWSFVFQGRVQYCGWVPHVQICGCRRRRCRRHRCSRGRPLEQPCARLKSRAQLRARQPCSD
eukprot:85339-Chlamydomonas_euryale.AAC.3